MHQKQMERPVFPSIRDDICVKWFLNNRDIWWPATITSIRPNRQNGGNLVLHATLIYHKLDNYPAEPATVIFSTNDAKERFVTSIDTMSCTGRKRSSMDPSSWRFAEEGSEEGVEEDRNDGNYNNNSPSRTTRLDASSSSREHGSGEKKRSRASPSSSATGVGNRSRKPTGTQHGGKKGTSRINSAISKLTRSNSSTLKAHLPTSTRNTRSDIIGNGSIGKASSSREDSMGIEGMAKNVSEEAADSTLSAKEKTEIDLRLRLIERQLQDVNTTASASLSSSAQSVIVALRWSLLKSLERPLKFQDLSSLSSHGLASHEINVVAQCDYHTFRELAASLAKEHNCGFERDVNSRVAFSPSYNTTQSGSKAIDNLNIIFSCLADLTTFLRIRDDNDFEGILSKEVVTETSTMLRILGTLTISEDSNVQKERTTNMTTTSSVSATSDITSTIRLFIGSAPVDYVRQSAEPQSDDVSVDTGFQSSVIQQECKHFCPNQKCFRSPWRSHTVHSNLSVSSTFDLDGTVPKKELQKYFVLNWSRLSAPSTFKWTRDVHDTANNSPGQLRLSIPYIFCTARRNVRSLVAILDSHIETFMKVRSRVQSLSYY